ncbi:MAG: hypothetical protein ACK5LP_03920 [Campylobacteraceae bacterium]
MHSFLLINKNPAVSKLLFASFNRLGYKLTEIGSYDDLVKDIYIGIIVDSQMYDETYINDLRDMSFIEPLIYLKRDLEVAPRCFDITLRKPFLPTDFISLMLSLISANKEIELYKETKENREILENDDVVFKSIQDSDEDIDEPFLVEEHEANAEKDFSFNGAKFKNDSILNKDDIDEIKNIFLDDIFDKKKTNDFSNTSSFEYLKQLPQKEEKFELETISEREMITALEDGGLLPKVISSDFVKHELKSAVEQSLVTAMQSKILRDALKGLKMNITITFEDN